LAQHPDIFMGSVKEPNHFHFEHVQAGVDRRRGMSGLAYKDRDKYLELFKDENGTRRVRFPKLASWLVFLADKGKYPAQ
jgi:hypothetical protein